MRKGIWPQNLKLQPPKWWDTAVCTLKISACFGKTRVSSSSGDRCFLTDSEHCGMLLNNQKQICDGLDILPTSDPNRMKLLRTGSPGHQSQFNISSFYLKSS